MPLDVRTLTPATGLADHLGDLARLRMRVFHDWPYLYDGDAEEERKYLSAFARSTGAVCIAAFDGGDMVGASTGLPLTDEHDEIKRPFIEAGIPIDNIFYGAESVLLPDHRGGGLYRKFMDGREAHARQLGGFDRMAFCGVIRPDDHPLKPADAKPLDDVWRHFGYAPREDLVCHFAWKDIDQDAETEKPLKFWLKAL
ncbi:MAG: GNAT family N-acetyltransferase [Rhodospirillales bacterium]|nr:GNAT family N-acetyltransferase [Rhodospirillales bacterium]MBO6787311.1 GNAT family N-acetyltransferase [Rhodospirillales bacterium]